LGHLARLSRRREGGCVTAKSKKVGKGGRKLKSKTTKKGEGDGSLF